MVDVRLQETRADSAMTHKSKGLRDTPSRGFEDTGTYEGIWDGG